MDLQLPYHLYKLFLLFEAFQSFALIIRHRYDTFPFCAKNFLALFYYINTSSAFCTFSVSSFSFFCFNGVVNSYGLYQLPFDYILVKTFCLLAVFRVSPQLKLKTTAIPKKSKTFFTNKNATPLSTKHVLFDMIKDCKSTSSPKFSQNCFSDQGHE